jgi:hypothetical protein
MSSTRRVPETGLMGQGELSADHAWRALRRYGGWRLLRDAVVRFRYGDGCRAERPASTGPKVPKPARRPAPSLAARIAAAHNRRCASGTRAAVRLLAPLRSHAAAMPPRHVATRAGSAPSLITASERDRSPPSQALRHQGRTGRCPKWRDGDGRSNLSGRWCRSGAAEGLSRPSWDRAAPRHQAGMASR